jgi:hypothetical protein
VVRDTRELKDTASLTRLRTTLLKEPRKFFKLLRDQLQADRDTTTDSLARLAWIPKDPFRANKIANTHKDTSSHKALVCDFTPRTSLAARFYPKISFNRLPPSHGMTVSVFW